MKIELKNITKESKGILSFIGAIFTHLVIYYINNKT
jgi:hypothetical protein